MYSTKVNQITFGLQAERIDGRKVSHFLGNEVENEDRRKKKKKVRQSYMTFSWLVGGFMNGPIRV